MRAVRCFCVWVGSKTCGEVGGNKLQGLLLSRGNLFRPPTNSFCFLDISWTDWSGSAVGWQLHKDECKCWNARKCYRLALLSMLMIALPGFLVNRFMHFRQFTPFGTILSFMDAYSRLKHWIVKRKRSHGNQHFGSRSKIDVVCSFLNIQTIQALWMLCSYLTYLWEDSLPLLKQRTVGLG